VCSHRSLSVFLPREVILKSKTCHHSTQELYIRAPRIYTQVKYKSAVLVRLLLFFKSTSNHIPRFLPTRHRNTTNILSTFPKMDYSNGLFTVCILAFCTTVCILGLILGVVFIFLQRQRDEQLLDDIYNTVCAANEVSYDAEDCNCMNGEQRQVPRNHRVPNYSSMGSQRKRASAA
jgi:hypothetical protein